MASDRRLPGGPPGVELLLRECFHVSATPSIGRLEAAKHIRAEAQARAITVERLDLSEQPVRRGALFDASGARVPFPPGEAFDRCYVALVDPEPRARWAHPAYWAFIPADGSGVVVLQDTTLPENAAGPVRLLPAPEDP